MLRSLWDKLRRPKNRFSMENLQYLHAVLQRHPKITEANRELLVETLRQLAEVLIWGDQHNPEFFDFFLEKNLLSYFLSILEQKTTADVKIQLLQTLSILIENIRHQNHVYFLLSNNHINNLITYKFDFSNEELLSYYVSLLKTLSLKLTPSTVQFFYNNKSRQRNLAAQAAASALPTVVSSSAIGSAAEKAAATVSPGAATGAESREVAATTLASASTSPPTRKTSREHQDRNRSFSSISHDFPLYTEAIKFFNHRETMIRIAVRTLTLNVYRVEDEDVRRFVLDKTAAPYFSNIVWYIRDQCSTLDEYVRDRRSASAGLLPTPSTPGGNPRKVPGRAQLDEYMAELQDFFYYLDDIFQLQIDEMSDVLSAQMLKFLVLPQIVGSSTVATREWLRWCHTRRVSASSAVDSDSDSDASSVSDDGPDAVGATEALSPLTALLLLLHIFYIFKSKALVNATARSLVGSRRRRDSSIVSRARLRYSTPIFDTSRLETEGAKQSPRHIDNSDGRTYEFCPNQRYLYVLACASGSCSSNASDNSTMQYVAVSLLLSIVRNGGIDHEILQDAGLLPIRFARAKTLLKRLTTSRYADRGIAESDSDSGDAVAARDPGSLKRNVSKHRRTRSDVDVLFAGLNDAHSGTSVPLTGDSHRQNPQVPPVVQEVMEQGGEYSPRMTSHAATLRKRICDNVVRVISGSRCAPGRPELQIMTRRTALFLLREMCADSSGSSGFQEEPDYALSDEQLTNLLGGYQESARNLLDVIEGMVDYVPSDGTEGLQGAPTARDQMIQKSHILSAFEAAIGSYHNTQPQIRKQLIDQATDLFEPPMHPQQELYEVSVATHQFLVCLESYIVFLADTTVPDEADGGDGSRTPISGRSSRSSSIKGSSVRGSVRGSLRSTGDLAWKTPTDFESATVAIEETMRFMMDLGTTEAQHETFDDSEATIEDKSSIAQPPEAGPALNEYDSVVRGRALTKRAEKTDVDPLTSLISPDLSEDDPGVVDAGNPPETFAADVPLSRQTYAVGEALTIRLDDWMRCSIHPSHNSLASSLPINEAPAKKKIAPPTPIKDRLRRKSTSDKKDSSKVVRPSDEITSPRLPPPKVSKEAACGHVVAVFPEFQQLVLARIASESAQEISCTVERVVRLDCATYSSLEPHMAPEPAATSIWLLPPSPHDHQSRTPTDSDPLPNPASPSVDDVESSEEQSSDQAEPQRNTASASRVHVMIDFVAAPPPLRLGTLGRRLNAKRGSYRPPVRRLTRSGRRQTLLLQFDGHDADQHARELIMRAVTVQEQVVSAKWKQLRTICMNATKASISFADEFDEIERSNLSPHECDPADDLVAVSDEDKDEASGGELKQTQRTDLWTKHVKNAEVEVHASDTTGSANGAERGASAHETDSASSASLEVVVEEESKRETRNEPFLANDGIETGLSRQDLLEHEVMFSSVFFDNSSCASLGDDVIDEESKNETSGPPLAKVEIEKGLSREERLEIDAQFTAVFIE